MPKIKERCTFASVEDAKKEMEHLEAENARYKEELKRAGLDQKEICKCCPEKAMYIDILYSIISNRLDVVKNEIESSAWYITRLNNEAERGEWIKNLSMLFGREKELEKLLGVIDEIKAGEK
jgi:hypothetical protein